MIGLLMGLIFMMGENDAGFLVIVSADIPIENLSKKQLSQLYLRKRDRIGRTKLTPIQLKEEHPVRHEVESYLFGQNFNLHDYWLQMEISGGEPPPLTVLNEAFVLVYVARNPGMIGYVPASLRGELSKFKVRVIEILE